MPYKYYQELGIVDSSADIAELAAMLIGLVLAVLLCRLQVGFFGHFNESSLLVMAGYLLAHAYYHRKDSDGSLDSWFL